MIRLSRHRHLLLALAGAIAVTVLVAACGGTADDGTSSALPAAASSTGAVAKVIPTMEQLVERIVERMKNGGRMFYIGAGTSGRLGVTDASELLVRPAQRGSGITAFAWDKLGKRLAFGAEDGAAGVLTLPGG